MLGLAVLHLPLTPASAGCAAPYLHITGRQVLERGEVFVIEGRSFVNGCQDSMSCSEGFGCGSCEYDEPAPRPMAAVKLRLVQADRTWSLGVADAETAEHNHLGWITWRFELPANATAGRAKLVPEDGDPVLIRIR